MKKFKKQGYTLFEILVVVVIIGTMAYFSVPLYNRVIQRSDVSDALYNMDILSTAQGKYYIENGKYTNNLGKLETPLKSEDKHINTTNFTYFAGDPQEDNYCIYSRSNIRNYTLARNYKTNSEVRCSGDDCNRIDSLITIGSLSDLCGNSYDGNCDKTCTAPKVLNDKECSCLCPIDCNNKQIQNDDCSCSCAPEWRANCSGPNQIFNESDCSCSCEKQLSCPNGKTFNGTTCACEGSCEIDENSCKATYKENYVFDEATCSCKCVLSDESCASQGRIFNSTECICEEEIICNDEQITACSGPNQILRGDCSCKCAEELTCIPPQVFNSRTCSCGTGDVTCALTEEDCAAEGKILQDCQCVCAEGSEEVDCPNGHFDTGTCACTCDLTDEICATYPGKRLIASTSPCKCVPSECPEDIAPCFNNNNNGHYNYRTCECECDLTDEYCREKFLKQLNPTTCECVAYLHE